MLATLSNYRGVICLAILAVLLPLAWAALFQLIATCGRAEK